MEKIKKIINQKRNVSLVIYLNNLKETAPTIMILPGGGYKYCSKRENEPVVECYLKASFNVVVLEYSVLENATWPNPLTDYENAINYLIENNKEIPLNLEKLALIGFSAGGHLAAAISSLSKHKPRCTILGYPVILRETIDKYLPSAPDITTLVNKDTPPHFIFASRTDQSVPINNTLEYLNQLNKFNIPFEVHIYAYAPHGFSICTSEVQDITLVSKRTPNWVNDSIGWLKEVFNGEITKN